MGSPARRNRFGTRSSRRTPASRRSPERISSASAQAVGHRPAAWAAVGRSRDLVVDRWCVTWAPLSAREDQVMDTAVRVGPHRVEPAVDTVMTSPLDGSRPLTVTAVYLLSEEGRKASLLAGGNGRAVQEITVTLPTTRLHLVTVDAHGRARLKLRPRFELNADLRVVRIDSPPIYDAPPTLDELFREAGRNHQ